MSKPQLSTRPTFDDANRAWKQFLQERNLPADLIWIFGDNLCFEEAAGQPGGFRLSYQTVFTPAPAEAEQIAYAYFADFEEPLVFYRLGSSGGKSVCLLLCDKWFQAKSEAEGFWHKPEARLCFRPGGPEQIDEVTAPERWKNRLLRNRPLHDLDFCMDLRAVHEILAHGRVLSTYEHYALRLLHIWRRMFDEHGQFHQ
jgi:hypothetical protein